MNAFYTKTNKITKKFLLTAPCISLFIIVITGLTLLPLVISYPEGSEVVPIFLALLFLALSALTFLLIGVPALCRRKKLVSKYEALPDADKAKIADDLHREFNGYMLRQNHLYFYQWQFINFTSYRDIKWIYLVNQHAPSMSYNGAELPRPNLVSTQVAVHDVNGKRIILGDSQDAALLLKKLFECAPHALVGYSVEHKRRYEENYKPSKLRIR